VHERKNFKHVRARKFNMNNDYGFGKHLSRSSNGQSRALADGHIKTFEECANEMQTAEDKHLRGLCC
jgi:hypothetical protein